MTTDTEEVVVTDEQRDAQLEDGFKQATGVVEPEPVVTPPVEEAVPVEEPAVEEPAEETVVLTQSEVKSLLARLETLDKLQASQDKAFGHIGSLSEKLKALQQTSTGGGNVEITDDDVKGLEEFGDFKNAAKDVFQRIASKLNTGGSAPAPVDLSPLEAKMVELEQRSQMVALSAMHRDWRQVTQGEGFNLWLQTQPAEYRVKVESSWNAEELAEALDTFKAATVEKAKVKAPENKARRLEAAVTPRGTPSVGGVQLTADQLMEQGFKNARHRI